MTAEISITSPPSTDGATQTRSFGVSVTAPDGIGLFQTELTASVDATQNGSFRELTSKRFSVGGGETDTTTVTTFIGVKPPYDLRVTATFTGSDGDTTTTEQTTTVGGSPIGGDTASVSTDTAGDTVGETGTDSESADTGVNIPTRGDAASITPRIGPVEPITLTAEYQLPWDRDNNQTACGQTIQTQNGDFNWRVVFNAIVTVSQLDELRTLRNSASDVETRTAAFGIKSVNFDQLNINRSDEPSVIEVDGTVEPLYEIQLQTKELGADDGEGLLGSNT